MIRDLIPGVILSWGAALLACLFMAGTASAAQPCLEDQPCWSWSQMGNHKRGIVTVWGNPAVVGPCGFYRHYVKARSVGMGRYFLRSNHVRGLHGDSYALRVGPYCGR